MGERMGQKRGHSQHLSCSPQKLNSEEKDAYYITRNIISVLSGNRMDHIGIFVAVGKFFFVVMFYSGSLKVFWPVAD